MVCDNSYHFAYKSTLVHSQVPRALQCPKHLRLDHTSFGGENASYFGTPPAPKVFDYCLLFLLMWIPHCCGLKEAESRAFLGAVGCENSINFASKSTLIHSQVPGAL